MSQAHIGLLRIVFYGFPQGRGVGNIDPLRAPVLQDRTEALVYITCIQHHAAAWLRLPAEVIHTVIGSDFRPQPGEGSPQSVGELALVGEEQRPLRGHRGVGQQNGVIGHVPAPEIEQPGQVVQRRQQKDRRVPFRQLLTQLRKLLHGALSGVSFLQQERRGVGQGGTVRPERIRQVQIGTKLALFPLSAKGLTVCSGEGAAIEAQPTALRQLFGQILLHRGGGLLPRPEQVDTGVRQLLLRLDPVAGVRPEPGAVREHQQRTGGAGEAGQEGAGLEVFPHIFRAVAVRVRRQPGVQALPGHPLPQQGQPFPYRLFFHYDASFPSPALQAE